MDTPSQDNRRLTPEQFAELSADMKEMTVAYRANLAAMRRLQIRLISAFGTLYSRPNKYKTSLAQKAKMNRSRKTKRAAASLKTTVAELDILIAAKQKLLRKQQADAAKPVAATHESVVWELVRETDSPEEKSKTEAGRL